MPTLPRIPFPADRLRWFREARFGMFIHWGLYSVLGRGEWAMSRERIPWSDYEPLLDRFGAEDYDPRLWAALARDAGMRYLVLTTKHHEGFCLWNSKLCPFNATRSKAGRDLLADYIDAVRGAGLKVGLYYSLGDWRNPDWERGWRGDAKARERFVEWTHGLVRELTEDYGPIDILWYDLPQCYAAADWRSVELNAAVRSRQPGILINNRAYTSEDFGTPEQHIAAAKRGRPWEACMTMNGHWGYNPYDRDWKSARTLCLQLAQVASGCGNLLLNVGPDGRGRIPAEAEERLRQVGGWLRDHGEAVYASEPHGLTWYLFGPVSRKGEAIYLHLRHRYGDTLTVGGLTNRVLRAEHLASGTVLPVEVRPHQHLIRGIPEERDGLPVVIKLTLEGEPDHDLSRVLGGADIFPDLPD